MFQLFYSVYLSSVLTDIQNLIQKSIIVYFYYQTRAPHSDPSISNKHFMTSGNWSLICVLSLMESEWSMTEVCLLWNKPLNSEILQFGVVIYFEILGIVYC